jgi:hypothetical protein
LCGEWLGEGRIGTIIFVGLSWQSRTNISLFLLLMCDGGPGQVVFGCLDMAGNVAGRYNLFCVGLEWLAVSYKSIYIAY